jgi:tRNA modification GTPase
MGEDALPQSGSWDTAVLSAAVLTPAGRGAVATISVRGPTVEIADVIDRHFVAANGQTLAQQTLDRICFGRWTSGSSTDLESAELSDSEEVVVSWCDEGAVEVCCHGGPTAVDRILDDLRKQGIATVSWQEHLTASSTSLDAELQSAMARATTKRTALKLLELQSSLPVEFARLQQLARSVVDGAATAESASAAADLSAALAGILTWVPFGLHLTTPWRVVLAGRPNVGKSTLMNALAGFTRAIVFDEPGTTRDVVSVETALDGWPVQLLDTAGIRDATNEIEREGVSRSRRALDKADCICLLLDAGSPLTGEDRQLMADVAASSAPAILVASKSDLDCVWETPLAEMSAFNPKAKLEREAAASGCSLASGFGLNGVPVSSVNDVGIDELIEAIVRQLVPQEPPSQTAVPVTVRQVTLLTAARAAADAGDLSAALTKLEKMNHGRDRKHGKE